MKNHDFSCELQVLCLKGDIVMPQESTIAPLKTYEV